VSSVGAVEVVMTPSAQQYRQLAADLEVLRSAGAETNTQAILDAVREQANRVRSSPKLREAA
jgi:hypothetical protein